jgi:hypothetical protein
MGGAHHDVGSLSRKRYTQYVGWTTTKGALGQLREHRRGPTRTKARKGVRMHSMHERSGRKTDTTGGAKKHQHARCEATREQTRSARTGDEGGASAGIQAAAFGCGGYPLGRQRQSADWVLGVRLRRTQLAALAPSWS